MSEIIFLSLLFPLFIALRHINYIAVEIEKKCPPITIRVIFTPNFLPMTPIKTYIGGENLGSFFVWI